MERALDLARDALRERLRMEQRTPVVKPADPEAALRELDVALTRQGAPLEAVAADLQRLLERTPVTTSRRFFNQLFGGRDEAAALGEIVASVVNSSMYTWKIGGAQVLVERHLLERMGRFVGYDGGEGLFCPGGSLSNFAAMLIARNATAPGSRQRGLDGRKLCVYTSEVSHYSIVKAAGMLGVGRDQVRRIPVDERCCMRVDAAAEAIQRDRAAGLTPFFLNATAGTTVEGAFDPIEPLADLAEREGMWLHVDGAFGGSAAVSPRWRALLAGSSRADSFTWDAHKMLGAPLTCSVALFRDEGVLETHLAEPAEYLFQDGLDEFNPGRRSLQCGRRNDALKLWTLWRCAGDEGLARRVDWLFHLAQVAASRVRAAADMQLVLEPQSVNVCFTVEGVGSQALCEALHERGEALVGWATTKGKTVVRLVCVDPAMREEDVHAFFDAVERAAAALRAGRRRPAARS